jgi:hypothetical protein
MTYGDCTTIMLPEYDHGNDLMYIFARFDENGSGTIDKAEPLHVFMIDLNAATQAKRLY